MTSYTFSWRYKFWWHKERVMGHRYEKDQNKMIIYFEDGSLREIKNWSDCEVKLGLDWVAWVKKDMEKKSGQSVPLNV